MGWECFSRVWGFVKLRYGGEEELVKVIENDR